MSAPNLRKSAKIGIVYIARGGSGGIESIQRFRETYNSCDAGIAHSLYIVAKRWETEDEIRNVEECFGDIATKILFLPDDGFDLGAYIRVAQNVPSEWLCFLNTHSRILRANWLFMLYDGAKDDGVGAAGATGSWESAFNALLHAAWPTGFSSRLRRAATLIGNWLKFPAFPNPHLRTNAFMTRTDVFVDFASGIDFPRTKRDVYAIESGSNSFSSYIRGRGLDLRVCGADGAVYSIEDWPLSGTYRSSDQCNLLVADNQTLEFSLADARLRKSLQLEAWGVSLE